MEFFVYGTLKRGYNMERIAPSAEFMCNAKVKGYKLYDLGAYPAMVEDEKKESVVYGEVWFIKDEEDIHRLDRYEGQAYKRIVVKAEVIDDDDNTTKRIDGWVLYGLEAYSYLYTKYPDKFGVHLVDGKWDRK